MGGILGQGSKKPWALTSASTAQRSGQQECRRVDVEQLAVAGDGVLDVAVDQEAEVADADEPMEAPKFKFLATLITLSALLFNGCDEKKVGELKNVIPQMDKASSGTKEENLATGDCVDRFEVLTQTPWMASHLAVNTGTGQMCRTWDWEQPNNIYGINRLNCPKCDETQRGVNVRSPICPARFEVLKQTPWMAAHLAVDTTTGKQCKTWDWEQRNNMYGITAQNTPLCVGLQQGRSTTFKSQDKPQTTSERKTRRIKDNKTGETLDFIETEPGSGKYIQYKPVK